MNKQEKAQVNYDSESDILYISSGEKARESIEVDNYVFDISSDGNVVGLEVNNASKFLSDLFSEDVRSVLSNMEASFKMIQSRELMFVTVVLYLKINGKIIEKNIQAPLPMAAV